MARSKVWKDSLYLGQWVTPSGQVFDCGPDDLDHFHRRAKDMLARGAPIPWGVEHHDTDVVKRLSAADRIAAWAERTRGHLHDARIREGVLEFLLDVDDKDKPLLESLKHVSPEIYHNVRDRYGPAQDETGPYWPGQSIAWLAVTPVPVQFPQQPFDFSGSVPLSLSRAAVDITLSQALHRPLRFAGSVKLSGSSDTAAAAHSAAAAAKTASKATYDPSLNSAHKTASEAAHQASRKAIKSGSAEHHAAAYQAHTAAAKVHGEREKRWASSSAEAASSERYKHARARDAHEKAANAHYDHSKSAGSSSAGAAKAATSLSGAKPMAKDPKAPPDDDEDVGDPTADDAGDTGEPDPLDEAPGEDLEPAAGGIGGPADGGLGDLGGPPPGMGGAAGGAGPGGPAAGMGNAQKLQECIQVLHSHGLMIGSDTSLENLCDRIVVAGNTMHATDAISQPEVQPGQNPYQQQPNPNEAAESQPIMMSQAQLAELEVLRRGRIKDATSALHTRINILYQRGYIDADIQNRLIAELRTQPVKLSSARPGELAENAVALKVSAYEVLMLKGKAGSFAPPSPSGGRGGARRAVDPHKPISSAVALSAGREEAVDPPYAPDDDQGEDGPVDHEVVNRLSGGRYDAYLAAKNGKQ